MSGTIKAKIGGSRGGREVSDRESSRELEHRIRGRGVWRGEESEIARGVVLGEKSEKRDSNGVGICKLMK